MLGWVDPRRAKSLARMDCAEAAQRRPPVIVPVSDSPAESAALRADERVGSFRVNGLKLAYREWGPSSATPIVLLHGLRGFSGTWRTFAASLSAEYRLIALDQRGRGDSDWDPACNYYTDAYLADLESIVERLRLDRFVLLGHSMGGTTSYVYADRHPARLIALVIEDIAPGSSVEGPGARRIVGELESLPTGFSSWAEARQYWRALRPTVSREAIEQRVAESLCADPDGRIRWRFDAEGICKSRLAPDPKRVVDLWPVVMRLSVPTLLIRGEKSDFCSESTVAQMMAGNPRIRAITVPGASHYVHDDAPVTFAAQVASFLKSASARGAHGRHDTTIPGEHR